MKKPILLLNLLSVLSLLIAAPSIQANFVQCPGGVIFLCDNGEGVTDEADIVNGTNEPDWMAGRGGDDLVFGMGSYDLLEGGDGNDVLFGGTGSDTINGGPGNDILLPGSDTDEFRQFVSGQDGNDTANVFAGEVSGCLQIFMEFGFDIVNLIGFGPYSLAEPFGMPGFVDGVIRVIDPIAGGRIYIRINEPEEWGAEIINGLPTPNVAFLTQAEFLDEVDSNTGTNPCPNVPPVGP